jgi:hypothetical protein
LFKENQIDDNNTVWLKLGGGEKLMVIGGDTEAKFWHLLHGAANCIK